MTRLTQSFADNLSTAIIREHLFLTTFNRNFLTGNFTSARRPKSNEIELITSKDAKQRQRSPIRRAYVHGRLRGYTYQLGRSPCG